MNDDRLWLIEDSEDCDCDKCRQMCTRSCWPLPEEAERLINLGYASQMMLDWWVAEQDIYIVCPAEKGYEGYSAPSWPEGKGCALQIDGLCSIHDVCKPYEGRISKCDRSVPQGHRERLAKSWDTDFGKSVVAKWKEAVDHWYQSTIDYLNALMYPYCINVMEVTK